MTFLYTGPPGQLSCSVTCPPMPFVSGLSDTCVVQWTTSQTASCAPITGYNIALTTLSPSVNVAASAFTLETVALEPFTTYTTAVTAKNDFGMTLCLSIFITSTEECE